MKLKLIIRILICFISLKFVQNQSCLKWKAWKDYKLEFNLSFYNNETLESIA
jgi:hypothetical protein